MKRNSRVIDTGGSGATMTARKSSGVLPVISMGDRSRPSELWAGVKSSDIGRGYQPVETASHKEVRRQQDAADPVWKNKFIRGSSEFIWFEITPRLPPKAKPKEVKSPINFKNKLDKRTRRVFTTRLGVNVENTANFMVKELAPLTLSLHSAMTKVEELVQQLIDEKVALPVSYLQSKMLMAMHLRVIRFVSEQFKLTDEERKLMALEFTRPWSQS